MRIDKFLISLISCIALIVILNIQLGSIPPLGKFLNPKYGFMTNTETSDDFISDSFSWQGSKVNGRIYFDDRLVPHIYAGDDYSLYFMEGYVHAKYRLWQMETQTRAAAGRLSEILGPDLLDFDRQQRRIGMVAGAEHELSELMKDSATYQCVLAYTDGVNRYLKQMADQDGNQKTFSYAEVPLEYKLLNYYPEEWTPLKSMLLLKYMANTLTGFDSDVEYTNLIRKMGRKDFDLLFPDRPEGIDPIIPSEKIFEPATVQIDTAVEFYSDSIYRKLEDKRTENDGVGSNNWAVAPSKTKNGNAILCNDPHLVLNLPSLWFEVQLHSPTQNVYGASLPGSPGIVIGFNDSISWGLTNGGIDVRDWYEITWRFTGNLKHGAEIPKNAKAYDEYRYNNSWLKVEKRVEVIKIKGEDDFIDTVYWTIHGPMVYRGFGEDKSDWENLAMRWSAIDPSNEVKTFYLLNRANNYDDYRQALRYFSSPTQNFVFASVNGDIAITQQGKHAVKWPEQGRFILDGKDPASEWQAFIPWEQNPFIKNPARGFVSSANQHPTDSTYSYYYTGFDFEFYRNRRINSQLDAMQQITVGDLQRLQQDNFNYTASEALPILFSKMTDPNTANELSDGQHQKLIPVYNALKEWDHYNSVNSVEATYFEIWWDTLYNLLWDEFDDEFVAYVKPDNYYTILAMKNLPENFIYFDILDTSKVNTTLSEVINRSFNAAVEIINSYSEDDPELLKWYRFKHTSILHIAQIPAFSHENIQNGGYRNIVNASSERNGPSWRMVVEMSRPINAYGIYPGGQSGNPGSKYYDNSIDDWAKGNYYQLLFFSNEEEARSKSKFTIQFKSHS